MASVSTVVIRGVSCFGRHQIRAAIVGRSAAGAIGVISNQCERLATPTSRRLCSSAAQPLLQKESVRVSITFKFADGSRKIAKAKIGESLLDAVIDGNLDIDGYGACEGTLACSTCHLVFNEENFAKLPSKATDEELDMLDLAYGLQDTSRLGCQVIVSKDMDGWEVTVPGGIADARS